MASLLPPLRRGSGVGTGSDVVLRPAERGQAGLRERPGESLPGPGEDLPQVRDTRVHPGRAGLGHRAETEVII